jgi:hypothetical protein
MKTKLFSNFGILFFLTIGALNITALDLKFNSGITKSPVIFYEGDVVTFTVNFISRGGIATNLKIIGGVDEAQAFERVFTSLPDWSQSEDFVHLEGNLRQP